MKFLILPAKDLQSGDVLFTTSSQDQNVKFCGRVLGLNATTSASDLLEFRVLPLVSAEGKHSVLLFRHEQLVGVAREDAYVDVDVAAILADY